MRVKKLLQFEPVHRARRVGGHHPGPPYLCVEPPRGGQTAQVVDGKRQLPGVGVEVVQNGQRLPQCASLIVVAVRAGVDMRDGPPSVHPANGALSRKNLGFALRAGTRISVLHASSMTQTREKCYRHPLQNHPPAAHEQRM